ncbi:carboxymuconolactone decarboxylase family protein [Dyadobacter aurulentus]|uniref:carboxymuconolactone decarboxylase family protein n=1 Tax=Dyadobacter sp. UC 10 TaxID=2605428 RepID=UPI0011F21E25|nr:carboxymuconolactone decarboxylase family protein [Dyadobacter sp. UC 10]KAA0993305.1 carboxymuconolactone decarboxylase family protein [Dyadobacter sp. UC 10]
MNPRISESEYRHGLMDGLWKNEMFLKKSELDPKMIVLMKYRVSQINSCAYCLDMHSKEAIRLGESDLRLHGMAAWKEAPYYSETERAVFAFAEALTNINVQDLPQKAFDDLDRFFTKSQIADLILAVSQINTWNRVLRALGSVPGNYKPGQFE